VNPDDIPDIDIDAASYRSAMDQLNMFSRDIADELAQFYTRLVAGGVPDELAGQLTINLELRRLGWPPE
jgi:hypothetical protein